MHRATANFTAFDIEDPNWTRARKWGAPKLLGETPSVGFRKTKHKTADRVHVWENVLRGQGQHDGAPKSGHRVTYVEADALVPNGWAKLQAMHAPGAGVPFNFILSDGLHTSSALAAEMTNLLSHNLFTPRASVIAWDDCGGPAGNEKLRRAVEGPLLKMMRAAHPTVCYARVEIGGWVGEAEPHHGCCVISTFPAAWTRSLFERASAAPPSESSPAAVAARAIFAQARKSMQCYES